MFGNWTIFRRLAAIGALASVALVAVAMIGTLSLNRMMDATDAIIDCHKQIEILSQSSMASLLEVRRYEKDLLINVGDPIKQEEYLKKWVAAIVATADIYGHIAATAPVHAERAALLQQTLKEYESSARKVIDDAMFGKYASSGEANDSISIVAKPLIHRIEENSKAVARLAAEEATSARKAAAENAVSARMLMLGLSIATALIALVGIAYIAKGIIRSLNHAVSVAKAVAGGKLDNNIRIDSSDETGQLLRALEQMQADLLTRLTTEQHLAAENLRIKLALDSSLNGTMLVDVNGQIIYINPAQVSMLARAETDIRDVLPDFDPHNLIGQPLSSLVRDTDVSASALAELAAPLPIQNHLGGRTFNLVLTPVDDEQGNRLGIATNWIDRTAELKIEREVETLVAAARQGDFGGRLSSAGKNGFYRALSEGLNQLLDTTAHGIADVAAVLKALAKGDLTRQVTHHYQGTLGELKGDTNATVVQLQVVVERIKSASDAIETAAREMSMGNANLSQRTEEQASSLEETASSMEELNATVRKNAENAHHASNLAQNCNEIASRGGSMVRQVVATMDEIQERSRKIGDIVGIIDGIAFQTNILALNAAVEAARAGEQGRGFAVVATEVRNLAQRSANAAKEIKQLISDSVAKVNDGAQLVATAGNTMDEVVKSFGQVVTLVADISHASGQQSTGIDQVTQAVSRMDETTQQNAALVEQAAAVAESLLEQVENLIDTVGAFRIDHDVQLAAPALPTIGTGNRRDSLLLLA